MLPRLAPMRRWRSRPTAPTTEARTAAKISLFDHLVGEGEQSWCDRQAERLGGFEVDDQLELGGLLDRRCAGIDKDDSPHTTSARQLQLAHVYRAAWADLRREPPY